MQNSLLNRVYAPGAAVTLCPQGCTNPHRCFMVHCSEYQTSSQLQRDSTNEVVPNTCCTKATNVNEE
ncbi:MAG: hypothetical protein RMZ41_019375 [Nostoc sp. DedVER02]|uniref:hypothetical protein n=1 Tax=Nostoc sp. DedVER02 TaxID=3075405 RepID=UPI00391AA83F